MNLGLTEFGWLVAKISEKYFILFTESCNLFIFRMHTQSLFHTVYFCLSNMCVCVYFSISFLLSYPWISMLIDFLFCLFICKLEEFETIHMNHN